MEAIMYSQKVFMPDSETCKKVHYCKESTFTVQENDNEKESGWRKKGREHSLSSS